MKRFIALTLLTLCMSITLYAQIKNTLFGCTLGETTMKSAYKILTNKGYYVYENAGSLFVDNPKFAGKEFSTLCLDFHQGILQSITLGSISAFNNIAVDLFKTLEGDLDYLYSIYKIKNECNETHLLYDDTSVVVFVDLGGLGDLPVVRLKYCDKKLTIQKIKEEMNDM